MPNLDIIIPVNNRPKVLERTLAAIKAQEIVPSWHVNIVVVNDGTFPEIMQVVSKASGRASPWCTYTHLDIPPSGAGAARNAGLSASSSPLILFLGADILLRPGSLTAHLDFHTTHPDVSDAALGLVKWDPRLEPTPLMEWMVHGGSQNDFDNLLAEATADSARYFYASHLSLKRALLPPQPVFDADFRRYGWEDIDLGLRLQQQGLRLSVLHQAVGLHHHYYTPDDIYIRQYAVGRNFVLFRTKHTAFSERKLSGVRKVRLIASRLSGLSWLKKMILKRRVKHTHPRLFLKITGEQFWWGVWKEEKEKTAKVR